LILPEGPNTVRDAERGQKDPAVAASGVRGRQHAGGNALNSGFKATIIHPVGDSVCPSLASNQLPKRAVIRESKTPSGATGGDEALYPL
jgi:hypothetical protein